jgi:hypothetical protein
MDSNRTPKINSRSKTPQRKKAVGFSFSVVLKTVIVGALLFIPFKSLSKSSKK